MKKSKLFKRILAYTLVLSVIFSQLVFSFNVSAADKVSVWDGTKAESFAGGNGSFASPYLIETAEQLYKMVAEYDSYEASKDKYFSITKDIYINNVNDDTEVISLWGKKNWLADYGKEINAASRSNTFSGTLNGNGHTIYGFYANGSSVEGSCLGLFPAISDHASIKDLHFNKLLITGGSGSAGAIAGHAYWKVNGNVAKITNCTVTDAIIGQLGNIESVGGLVGNTNDCTITFANCYTKDVQLSLYNDIAPGGITGNAWGSGTVRINNCYSAGYFPVRANISKAICTNVYTDAAIPEGNTTEGVTVLSTEQMKGEAAKQNMAGLDFVWIWKTVENDYPVTRENPVFVWDGKKVTGLDKFVGNGSAANPYQIENASQLAYVVSTDLTDGLHFKLVKDIRINDTTKENWKESAQNWVWADVRFVGTFDGNGHTIDGLFLNKKQKRFGLFSYVGDSLIKNFNITNAYIYDEFTAGDANAEGIAFVAAQASAKADFEGIFIDANSYLNAPYIKGVAGIVGRSNQNINIRNCAVLATIEGKSHVGAFYGTHWGGTQTLNNCYSASNVPVMPSRTLQNSANNYAIVLNGTYDKTTTLLTADQMKGDAAKINMSGLDFNLIWQTVENGYPIFRENARYNSWDGKIAENFAGGTGTAEDPFLIENGGQLYKMVAEYSTATVTSKPVTQTYFKLTKDINLGGKQWYTISVKKWLDDALYSTIGFNGVIDGGGHTVYNLYNNTAAGAVGLIPLATQGTKIYDLHLVNGTLPRVNYQTYACGALIGMARGASSSAPIEISRCSVENFTIASCNGTGAFVGYMYSQSIAIEDCYAANNNLSHTSADSANSAAFIGYTGGNDYGNSIIIKNSHSADVYPLPYLSEKFAAITTFENVYTCNEAYDGSFTGLTKLTAAQMTGVAAKDNIAGLNFNQIWQVGAEGEYPTLYTNEYKAMYWNGTAATEFAGGTGNLETPYMISNAEQLYLLANADTASTAGKYYVLTNDIDISAVREGWANENPYSWAKKTAYLDGFGYSNSFAGTLDGAGYTVSGLYYSDEITNNGTYAYGLIPFVSANAVIKNINVEYAAGDVTGSAYTGAVAGAAHVTKEDIVNPLNMVQFVGVNVSNSNLAVLGGASRGVKFELCNAETLIAVESENISVRNCNSTAKYSDDVLIFNNENKDSETLTYIINYILGDTSRYITDINGDANFNLLDLVSIKKAFATLPSDEYQMVWSQEFDGDAVDYSVLTTNTTMGAGSNLEFANNATVSNGNLTLSCNDTGKTNDNGKIYSVNYGLSTIDTMSFKYGKLEMRAKVPFGAGAWPSLWLTSRNAIGYDAKSEYSTEIDIFEVFAKESASNALVTCIHKWYNDANGTKTGDECSNGSAILAGNGYKVEESDRSYTVSGAAQNEYHTFVFEWDEDSMSFSVDGTVYYTALRSQMENFDITGYDTNSDGIFNQPLCIRVNNHMYPSAEGIDTSLLDYEIDYIRLYQKNDGKSEITFR